MTKELALWSKGHNEYIEARDWDGLLEIASAPFQQEIYRELLHILLLVGESGKEGPHMFSEFHYFHFYELNGVPLTVYSDNHSVIAALKNKSDSDLLNTLIPLMKRYHCCVDHSFSSLNFGTKPKESKDERLIVIISSVPKTAFDTLNQLHHLLSKCEILLWEKYSRESISPIQLFFLLTFYSLDTIELKSREEMEKHFSHPDEPPYKQPSEMLGCYFYHCDGADFFKRDQQVIYLCPELINAFSQELYSNDFPCCGVDFEAFYNLIFELVLFHELGHLAFSCLDLPCQDESLTEGRANFFASYITNGVHDHLIKLKTQHQPAQYHTPILVTDSDWKSALHL